MPANLTPQYMKAEQRFKAATTNEERILALEEMLRVIPKHKGTEHIQGELKKKLSKLREAPEKKTGGKQVDIFHIPRGGAAQVVLLGTPNSGKSSIPALLTNANVIVADFPFSTSVPVPGMILFEDIQIQILDMPPITAEHVAPAQIGAYRNCDLIAIVIDLSADIAEQMKVCLGYLESKNLLAGPENNTNKKVVCLCTKADIEKPNAFEQLKKSCAYPFEFIRLSTETGEGFEELPGRLFKILSIIRIYSKPPGKEPDMKEPFILPAGSTVMDLAMVVHRQMAEKLKSSRIWGTAVHPGQNVNKTHILNDRDIVELHFA